MRFTMPSSTAETRAIGIGLGRPSSSQDTVVKVSPPAECRWWTVVSSGCRALVTCETRVRASGGRRAPPQVDWERMEVQRGYKLYTYTVHTHTRTILLCKKENSLQYFYFCLHSNKSPANQIINTLGLNRVPPYQKTIPTLES